MQRAQREKMLTNRTASRQREALLLYVSSLPELLFPLFWDSFIAASSASFPIPLLNCPIETSSRGQIHCSPDFRHLFLCTLLVVPIPLQTHSLPTEERMEMCVVLHGVCGNKGCKRHLSSCFAGRQDALILREGEVIRAGMQSLG